MENIKKEKNNHVCLIISFVLMIVVEIYSFLVSNIFNVFIITGILFYFLEQKNKKKQMNYLKLSLRLIWLLFFELILSC